jgi:hypothetical protein
MRSPIDITLSYDRNEQRWSEWIKNKNTNYLIEHPADGKPYVQMSMFYIFWTEQKSNTKLWQHDPPLYALDRLPTWYTVSGMIPIGEYTRNTSVGFILRPNENEIRISRGDVISSLTFVGDSAVKLVKKLPTSEVLEENTKNKNKKRICPYTLSRELFARWLK